MWALLPASDTILSVNTQEALTEPFNTSKEIETIYLSFIVTAGYVNHANLKTVLTTRHQSVHFEFRSSEAKVGLEEG